MNTNLIAESDDLRQTARRLQRVGLIVDCGSLSPAHRRAYFALQCHVASCLDEDEDGEEPNRRPIGFEYPNAR